MFADKANKDECPFASFGQYGRVAWRARTAASRRNLYRNFDTWEVQKLQTVNKKRKVLEWDPKVKTEKENLAESHRLDL